MAITLTREQFKERYGEQGLNRFKPITQREKPGFFGRAKEALGERFGDIKETFGETARGEISPVETGIRTVGDVAGGVGDIIGAAISPQIEKLAQTKFAKPAFEKLAQGLEVYEKWKNESETNNRIAEVVESVVNIADVVAGTKGAGKIATATTKAATRGTEAVIAGTKAATRRVFDVTKSVPERISNVRSSIKTGGEVIEEAGKKTTTAPSAVPVTKKASVSFAENPTITGAVEDIKIMVGLPESTPATDLTFRAVKPRLTKSVDLRRVKTQMELANQTIVENGFKPTNIREYADAVYQTKKKVWEQIQTKLDEGQLAGQQVDLTEIAVKILDRADDPALIRTNPQAAKQLIKIAEDLVRRGDTVDILEAERIKQFLNAELSDAFGATDLSQQAKEAKKLITLEIGKQLDDKLSTLPAEFKDLKIKYGSLSAIEDDILKRAIVFERQNPEGLADILTKTEAAAEIAFGGTRGRLKGIARLTLGRQLKKANDVNELIRRAFEKLSTELK